MTIVATSACMHGVTAVPITRAKYSQRMNGRIMASNRTRESKNGFTPPVELAATAATANSPVSYHVFAFADSSKRKHESHDFSTVIPTRSAVIAGERMGTKVTREASLR